MLTFSSCAGNNPTLLEKVVRSIEKIEDMNDWSILKRIAKFRSIVTL